LAGSILVLASQGNQKEGGDETEIFKTTG